MDLLVNSINGLILIQVLAFDSIILIEEIAEVGTHSNAFGM